MSDLCSPLESAGSCRTPLGWVSLFVADGHIRRVEIDRWVDARRETGDPLARIACLRIREWLEGGDWPRDLPLAPSGTPFQQRVWSTLREIPPGERRTYGELARELGTSPRAVGGACRANPVPLLIPCHRVVAANGDGGFAGHTEGRWLEIKRWLLDHE